MKRIALVVLFVCAAACAEGQNLHHAQGEATVSRKTIRIGEQDTLRLRISYQEGTKKTLVKWPSLIDTLTKTIEIVKTDTIHTQLVDRASVLYAQTRNIIITAFDSGMFTIPAQSFVVDNDTIRTNELQLYVSFVPVDTTKPIKDIRDIYDVPPVPVAANDSKGTNWWLWGIVSAIIIAGIVLFVLLRKKKKPEPESVRLSSSHLLPHERVLEKLAELGRRRPWAHDLLKEYHVELTEILRDWIMERYSIQAKEMTTGEILTALAGHRVDGSAVMLIERVLRAADMVKFAKQIPGDEENEKCLELSMSFVQATAVIPQPVIQPQPVS